MTFGPVVSGTTLAEAEKGWKHVTDFLGLRRDQVVAQSKIRRPTEKDYRGGYEAEGYAEEVKSEKLEVRS